MPQTRYGPIPIYTLLILVSFAAVAAVLFTPGLPALQQQFHLTTKETQLTVSLFLLGYTIGPLIYGPLANRHGRKNMLYSGIGIAFIASFFCAWSAIIGGYKLFLIARFMSAIGSSAGLTLGFTIINDVFTELDLRRKIIAYTTLAFAIMPGLAVSLGGVLVSLWGWRSCFYAFMIYCFVVSLLVFRLPETRPDHLPKHTLRQMLSQYYYVGRNAHLLLYSIMWGCTVGIIYTFAAIAPIISQQQLHLSASQFGVYNLLVFLGLMIGNLLSARLVSIFAPRKVMAMGIMIALSGTLLLLFITLQDALTVWRLFLATMWIFIGLPTIFSNAAALAMVDIEDKATASSIMNALDMGTASVIVLISGYMHYHMDRMISVLFMSIMLVIIVLFNLVRIV